MRLFTARVTRLSAVGPRAHIYLHADVAPGPGQFCLAPGSLYLRRPIYPARLAAGEWATELAEAAYPPGATLELLGPLGRGFELPDSARNVLLVALGPSPAPLLPVAAQALARGRSVTLVMADRAYPLSDLPAELEVRADDLTATLPEALAWADAVYVEPGPEGLPALRRWTPEAWPAARTQALLTPPMPCGVGACGACAVHTRRGWRLACADGPVFTLGDLEIGH